MSQESQPEVSVDTKPLGFEKRLGILFAIILLVVAGGVVLKSVNSQEDHVAPTSLAIEGQQGQVVPMEPASAPKPGKDFGL